MSDKPKIKWQGPGWYVGRYYENGNVIVERVADHKLTWAEAVERAGSKNVSSYSDPPPHMEVVEDVPGGAAHERL